ncbi:MAG: 50S ribosomal protein L18e [Nanoarchaeota archaeon]|nr:50S ribosomal protein L18e [Nanoarchaeota archaeon]
MKSKTKISKQSKRKTNSILVETIMLAKKNKNWLKVAEILSGPRKRMVNKNLKEIGIEIKEGEKIIVPGKVLSQGDIDKKIKIVALNFSEKAKEKLIKTGCETSYIMEEIKKNPEAKGIKILEK